MKADNAPIVRDAGAADVMTARAAAAGSRALSQVLGYVAGRQLRRVARASEVRSRDLEIAPTVGKIAPTAGGIAPTAGGIAPTAGGIAPTGGEIASTAGEIGHAARPGAAAEVKVIARSSVGENLLRLIVSRPDGFDYRPGQHVKLGLANLARNYSLVSAPHQRDLEFFIELVPGGRVSEHLRLARPGTALRLGGRAKGKLQVDGRFPNQLLIATVTGVAPYVSMLRDHIHRGASSPRRFVVLHGASFADELGYDTELVALARQHPHLVTYLPTVSRPQNARNAGWTGARGRVESQVDPALTRFGMTPADTAAFACGHPGMVAQVADALRRRGFTIHTEPY